jgi:hypothetical protein
VFTSGARYGGTQIVTIVGGAVEVAGINVDGTTGGAVTTAVAVGAGAAGVQAARENASAPARRAHPVRIMARIIAVAGE